MYEDSNRLFKSLMASGERLFAETHALPADGRHPRSAPWRIADDASNRAPVVQHFRHTAEPSSELGNFDPAERDVLD